MGLYLCVFAEGDGDEELEGVEVGSYDDFGRLRETIAAQLEPGGWGTRFPVLMSHVDSDGRWSPREAGALAAELSLIAAELAQLPPQPLPDGWQSETARKFGIAPGSLRDCYFDVDGEPLFDRLIDLAGLAAREGLPISFQ